jgi:transposase
MLYLAIDQHSKQWTVSVRNEEGTVIQRRQVSTEPARARAFLEQLRQESEPQGGFLAILEVCGFNDWLLKLLAEYGGREIVLIHPEKRSKRKTDRRDADALGELLWNNRHRLLAGQKPQGLRRVVIPSETEQQDRQLTALRQRAGQRRTRTINQIKHILLRHNLLWQSPTRTFQTRAVREWLRGLTLPAIDRLEMNQLLAQWELWDHQLVELDHRIQQRAAASPAVQVLRTAPGVSHYSGLALASRFGRIERFRRPRSLANYIGLVPGCRNSGLATDRLGSITKDGSRIARFILGQLVLHTLRQDRWMRQWYQQIKRRRGAKIARVAVMRRLLTIYWHMLTYQEPYTPGGPPRLRQKRRKPEVLVTT